MNQTLINKTSGSLPHKIPVPVDPIHTEEIENLVKIPHSVNRELTDARPVTTPFRLFSGTLVEYLLILTFISVLGIAVLVQLGRNVSSVFTAINTQLVTAQMCH